MLSRIAAGVAGMMAVGLLGAGPGWAGQPKDAVVLVGTLPLTGSEARSGLSFKDGYELAVQQANAAGGVKVGGVRRPVSLLVADDKSEGSTAVQLMDELARQHKPAALLATYSTTLATPQSALAEKLGIPYMAGGVSGTEVFSRDRRWVFGVSAPTKMMAYAVLDWMHEQQQKGELPSPLRVAVAAEQTGHGTEFIAGARAYAERSRGALQIIFSDRFELNQKDFGPLLKKLADVRADAFIVDAHFQDFVALHQQYAAAGLCHRVVSYGARGAEPEARQKLGASAHRLLSAVWWQDGIAGNAEARRFSYSFRERYRRVPQWQEALAYESVRALLAAIEAAGTTDHEAVRAHLAADKMPSLMPGGQLSFPDSLGHQAHSPYVVQQNFPDGTAPVVYPAYAASADGRPGPACGATKTAAR